MCLDGGERIWEDQPLYIYQASFEKSELQLPSAPWPLPSIAFHTGNPAVGGRLCRQSKTKTRKSYVIPHPPDHKGNTQQCQTKNKKARFGHENQSLLSSQWPKTCFGPKNGWPMTGWVAFLAPELGLGWGVWKNERMGKKIEDQEESENRRNGKAGFAYVICGVSVCMLRWRTFSLMASY